MHKVVTFCGARPGVACALYVALSQGVTEGVETRKEKKKCKQDPDAANIVASWTYNENLRRGGDDTPDLTPTYEYSGEQTGR